MSKCFVTCPNVFVICLKTDSFCYMCVESDEGKLDDDEFECKKKTKT